MTKQFVENFSKISQGRQNSMGMVAEVGETQIKRIPDLKQRSALIQKYNSYGLGKTHLQIAIAKEFLQQGHAVLCISDVVFMHDLAQSKRYSDEGSAFYRLLNGVIEAEVLVWDDIGKSKYTEAKEELYYRIINERYRQRKPILFSSNEDELTLSERIGEAAFSRLYSMAKDYFVKVKGPDYRVEGT
jgi:DNA replication protein DnaC